ncbi:Golgin subfamily A member 7/ERF4 family-domain-containing protein [Collybia nuda]|uniref:Ras modification protein ERF4 n=1 Tax=Collybia nuda TaxID=64659 RepID=A0A9P5XUW3_9AGAR|nr:Golgin subfamily A member 7/ERF4 family-domain-containing protein [Collybia nuda]
MKGVTEDFSAIQDPLRTDSKEVDDTQDLKVVVEEDVVDSNGRLLYPGVDLKPSPVASRRTSHLRLDLKPPSPQPWELIDPPDIDGKSGPDYYSTLGSKKFHTLQSATHTRPLIPKSSYYFGPPPSDSAYGTHPIGQIGVHHPREVLRIERDYTGGELIQFAPIYPLEIEGRITPTQFLESINSINELLISAHSLRHSFLDNMLAVFSLQLSKLIFTSHYEKEMQRLRYLVDDLNTGLYNPVGLNILWPRNVAFLFVCPGIYIVWYAKLINLHSSNELFSRTFQLEIEYY